MSLTHRTPAHTITAAGIVGALTNCADAVSATDKTLRDYGWSVYVRMLGNPWRVKAAITGETDWYGEPHWYPDEGGEDIDALEALALVKLDGTDLTTLERADVEAALDALDDFRQRRKNREG
jgi:hypothetical protein